MKVVTYNKDTGFIKRSGKKLGSGTNDCLMDMIFSPSTNDTHVRVSFVNPKSTDNVRL